MPAVAPIKSPKKILSPIDLSKIMFRGRGEMVCVGNSAETLITVWCRHYVVYNFRKTLYNKSSQTMANWLEKDKNWWLGVTSTTPPTADDKMLYHAMVGVLEALIAPVDMECGPVKVEHVSHTKLGETPNYAPTSNMIVRYNAYPVWLIHPAIEHLISYQMRIIGYLRARPEITKQIVDALPVKSKALRLAIKNRNRKTLLAVHKVIRGALCDMGADWYDMSDTLYSKICDIFINAAKQNNTVASPMKDLFGEPNFFDWWGVPVGTVSWWKMYGKAVKKDFENSALETIKAPVAHKGDDKEWG